MAEIKVFCLHCGQHIQSDEGCRKAAERGDATAQYNLGRSYYIGDGVNKSITEAVKWCEKAAEQGNAGAQYFLGACYVLGEGDVTRLFQAS